MCEEPTHSHLKLCLVRERIVQIPVLTLRILGEFI